jgi:hypothetical protein
MMPIDNLTERYLVPGERRVVDAENAAKLRAIVSRAALELGFDKVTSAVVLVDYGVELLATNDPPYPPTSAREVSERAIVVHYAAKALAGDVGGLRG